MQHTGGFSLKIISTKPLIMDLNLTKTYQCAECFRNKFFIIEIDHHREITTVECEGCNTQYEI